MKKITNQLFLLDETYLSYLLQYRTKFIWNWNVKILLNLLCDEKLDVNTYEYNSLAICIFNLINYVYCHHARLVVVAIFCSEYSMTSCCMLFTVTISSALTASPFYSAIPAPGQGHTADIWAHHYSYSDMRSSLSNIKIVPSENRGASVKNFWIWQRLKKSEKRCKRWDGGRQNRGEGSDMTPPPIKCDIPLYQNSCLRSPPP